MAPVQRAKLAVQPLADTFEERTDKAAAQTETPCFGTAAQRLLTAGNRQ